MIDVPSVALKMLCREIAEVPHDADLLYILEVIHSFSSATKRLTATVFLLLLLSLRRPSARWDHHQRRPIGHGISCVVVFCDARMDVDKIE